MKQKEKNIKEELNELFPYLNEIKKKDNGFQLPEHYFETFQDNVLEKVLPQQRVLNQEVLKNKKSILTLIIEQIERLLQPKPALAMAFCSILLFGLLVFPFENESAKLALEEVETDDIQNYVIDNIDAFDESILIAQTDSWDADTKQEETIEERLFEDVLEETEIGDLEDLL